MADTEVVESYPTNFETWIEEFNEWQTRIGFDPSWLGDYRFDIKFDWDTAGKEIEFGDFGDAEVGSKDADTATEHHGCNHHHG